MDAQLAEEKTSEISQQYLLETEVQMRFFYDKNILSIWCPGQTMPHFKEMVQLAKFRVTNTLKFELDVESENSQLEIALERSLYTLPSDIKILGESQNLVIACKSLAKELNTIAHQKELLNRTNREHDLFENIPKDEMKILIQAFEILISTKSLWLVNMFKLLVTKKSEELSLINKEAEMYFDYKGSNWYERWWNKKSKKREDDNIDDQLSNSLKVWLERVRRYFNFPHGKLKY